MRSGGDPRCKVARLIRRMGLQGVARDPRVSGSLPRIFPPSRSLHERRPEGSFIIPTGAPAGTSRHAAPDTLSKCRRRVAGRPLRRRTGRTHRMGGTHHPAQRGTTVRRGARNPPMVAQVQPSTPVRTPQACASGRIRGALNTANCENRRWPPDSRRSIPRIPGASHLEPAPAPRQSARPRATPFNRAG